MRWPELPNSWIVLTLAVTLIFLRWQGVDSWTTAALSMLIGWVTGKHIEQAKQPMNGYATKK